MRCRREWESPFGAPHFITAPWIRVVMMHVNGIFRSQINQRRLLMAFCRMEGREGIWVLGMNRNNEDAS